MATKTLYVTNTAAATPFFGGALQDGGSAPSAANSTYGWIVAKGAANLFWRARLGASALVASGNGQASSQIDSQTAPQKGTGSGATTAGDSFWAGPYSGTFGTATSWVFDGKMRASVASSQTGRLRMRVWKSANADGTGATALTGSTQVGTTTAAFSTTADVTSTVTWTPGTTITLNNEYLFFEIEWQAIVAGGSTTADVRFRVGTALITTPDFSPSVNAVVAETLGALTQAAAAELVDVIWDKSAAHINDPSYYTLTNGNLTAERAAADSGERALVASKGRVQNATTAYYYEVTINAGDIPNTAKRFVGLADYTPYGTDEIASMFNYPGRGGISAAYGFSARDTGEYFGLEGDATYGSRGIGFATFDDGDVIGVLLKTRTAGTIVQWDLSVSNSTYFRKGSFGVSIQINGGGTLNAMARANVAMPTNGYFECIVHDVTNSPGQNMIGLCNASQSISSNLNTANAIAYGSGGNKYGTETGTGGATWVDGDVIGVMYTGTQVKFYRNGALQYTCSTLPSGSLYPAIATGNVWFGVYANFGSLPYANTPSGAVAVGTIHGDAEVYKNGTLVATFKAPPTICYPAIALGNFVTIPDKATANFGATAFANQPAGTTSWDGSRVASSGPTAVVSQTLGTLGQTATATASVAAAINQALGNLGQAATATDSVAAAVSQALGTLGQSVSAAAILAATTAQTLGALTQTLTATAKATAVVNQTLGVLQQVATALATVTGAVNQSLGPLGQTAAAAAIDVAAVAQTFGALNQAANAGVVDTAVVNQALGALQQAAAMQHTPATAVYAGVFGALGQAATAAARLAGVVSQTLGTLGQTATAAARLAAVVNQSFGALGQAATATAVDSAAVNQTLGALQQSAAAAASVAAAVSQTLGALRRTVAFDPARKDSAITLSNSNLTATFVSGTTPRANADVYGQGHADASGKFFYTIDIGGPTPHVAVGFAGAAGQGSVVWYYTNFVQHTGPGASTGNASFGFASGDTVGCEWDPANATVKFYKWVAGAWSLAWTETNCNFSPCYPLVTLLWTSGETNSATANFGASPLGLPVGDVAWDSGALDITHPDVAAVAQTLGALQQAVVAAVTATAVVSSQSLGALQQAAAATTGAASVNAVVAQTLGTLGQSATAAAPVAAAVSQALGGLGQALTAAAVDTASVAQTLPTLAQAATAAARDAAAVSQSLGPLGQAAAAAAVDTAVVNQSLGPLGQVAFSTQQSTGNVNQSLGALGQVATGKVIDAASATQILGAIVQVLTGAAIDSATVAQALGSLQQVATAGHVSFASVDQTLPSLGQVAAGAVTVRATVSQVLGTLAQIATATTDQSAHAAVDQLLGALQQVATSTDPLAAQANQILGALLQVATSRSTRIPHHKILGSFQRTRIRGSFARTTARGSFGQTNIRRTLQ